MTQAYGEVAGEASGEASGEEPMALAPVDLCILSLFPGDVFSSALDACLACRLQRLTLPTEIFISEATSCIVLP